MLLPDMDSASDFSHLLFHVLLLVKLFKGQSKKMQIMDKIRVISHIKASGK